MRSHSALIRNDEKRGRAEAILALNRAIPIYGGGNQSQLELKELKLLLQSKLEP
jgi:hypothetical protein